MKNSDMPAMPIVETGIDERGFDCDSVSTGLTKREYFAAMAMRDVLAAGRPDNVMVECRVAVAYADALLAELERQ